MFAGHVLVCDDIREEVGGKHTYVGTYKAALICAAPFPNTLPKLCVVITLLQTLDEPRLPVTIKVFFPGDTPDEPSFMAEAELPMPELPLSDLPLNERQLMVDMHLVFSPVSFKHAGEIWVMAERDGKKHSLRRVAVLSQSDAIPHDAAVVP